MSPRHARDVETLRLPPENFRTFVIDIRERHSSLCGAHEKAQLRMSEHGLPGREVKRPRVEEESEAKNVSKSWLDQLVNATAAAFAADYPTQDIAEPRLGTLRASVMDRVFEKVRTETPAGVNPPFQLGV